MTEQEIQTVDAAVRWITALSGAFLIPVVIILMLLYLLGSKRAPERLAHLMQPFSSFKFLGTEFVVSDAVKVSASAETTLRGGSAFPPRSVMKTRTPELDNRRPVSIVSAQYFAFVSAR